MDPIKELEARLNEMVSSREAFAKHVDRAALKEYISTLVSETRSVVEALSEITTPTMGAAIKRLIDQSKSTQAVKTYQSFLSELKKQPNKNAFKAEDTVPFSSLVESGKRWLVILTELESNVDDLFKHNTINLFNGRLSHVVVIGLIAEARMLVKFSKYLLSAVVSAVTNQRDIAKYRYVWMDEYMTPVGEMVSKSLGRTDNYNFKAIIKDLQTKAVDVALIDDFNKTQLDMVNNSKVSTSAKSLIKAGIKKLGLFRWIGEIFVNRKQEKIEKKRREVEWMKAHVELLKMKLDEMDEDDPEYQRLVKIIQRYEEMITKADKEASSEESK